jgi:hypothetical protein
MCRRMLPSCLRVRRSLGLITMLAQQPGCEGGWMPHWVRQSSTLLTAYGDRARCPLSRCASPSPLLYFPSTSALLFLNLSSTFPQLLLHFPSTSHLLSLNLSSTFAQSLLYFPSTSHLLSLNLSSTFSGIGNRGGLGSSASGTCTRRCSGAMCMHAVACCKILRCQSLEGTFAPNNFAVVSYTHLHTLRKFRIREHSALRP